MIKPSSFEDGPNLKPTSSKQTLKEMKAALRLAYGPQKRTIKGEIAASKLAAERAIDYFNTYGESIDAASSRTSAAYKDAQKAIGQNSTTAAKYAETLRNRLAAEAQADAQKRGVVYDPSGSNVGVEANLARINSANVLSAVTGASGAASKAHFEDKGRIGDRESIEQQFREQARQRSLSGELKTMAGDMAASLTGMYATARDSDRDFYLGLQAAKEPGRDRSFDASQAAKDRNFQGKEGRKDRGFQKREGKKDRRASPPSGGSDTGGDGGDGESSADVKRLVNLLESQKDKVQQKYAEDKAAAIRALLNSGRSYSQQEAERAYQRWLETTGRGGWG